MKNISKIILFLAPMALFGFFVHAQSTIQFFLLKNMKLGDSGPEVKQLQIFLNSTDTKIAVTGPGSPGNETNYFGLLTENAVKSFQNKYRAEILAPSNLISPTGFVGPATIKKIRSLFSTAPAQNNQNPGSLPSSTGNLIPMISSVSKVLVDPGDKVVISGKFYGSPTVYFNESQASSKKLDSSTLEATVPDIHGIFTLWVGDQHGESRGDFPFQIIVGEIPSDIVDKIVAQNEVLHKKAIDPRNQ